MSDAPASQRMLTLAGGGWVLLVALAVSAGLIIWAVAPAVFKVMQRPPGDGLNVESYGFNLSTLTIPRATLHPVMLHRDMVPVLTDPPIISADEAVRLSDEERGKFLVSTDRVIGVSIGREHRAYPIQLLNVHELVNDTLGDVPIAVSYSWLGDIPRVFDRRVDGQTLEFGVSGLITNANTLLYDRRPGERDGDEIPWAERGESLWRQLDGRAVSGPAADGERSLTPINAQLVSWRHWLELHPDTTVLARDPTMLKRYRRSTPSQYFRSADIPYPVDPLPERVDPASVGEVHEVALQWKDRVIVVRAGAGDHVIPLAVIAAESRRADTAAPDELRQWRTELDETAVSFTYDPRAETVAVDAAPTVEFVHCFWFLWFAHHAESAEASLVRPE